MRESRDAYRILVGKPEGRRPLGKSRLKREDNIKMNVRQAGWKLALDRSGSKQEQVTGSCEYGNEHSGCIKCEQFPDLLRIS
jgi:hypothetical protein